MNHPQPKQTHTPQDQESAHRKIVSELLDMKMDVLRTSTGPGGGSVGSSPTHALRRAIEAAAAKKSNAGGGKDGGEEGEGKGEQEVRPGVGTEKETETGLGLGLGLGVEGMTVSVSAKATTLSTKSLVYRKPTEKHVEVGRSVCGYR